MTSFRRQILLVLSFFTVIAATIAIHAEFQPLYAMSKRVAMPLALMFDYVSARSGKDTKIVLLNTSKDYLGTTTETSGQCTLHFYGLAERANFKTPIIAAGASYSFMLSDVAPNFEGYIIAECDFSLARGEALYGDSTKQSHVEAEILTLPRDTSKRPLLFSYAVNQDGFNSGFVLTNTSEDSFGTTASAGSCYVYFYGTNAPAAFITPTIAAGEHYNFTLSSVAPNFNGYVIANCNFGAARGYELIYNANLYYELRGEPLDSPRSTAVQPMLFSFVTNQAGFETAFFVANTTTDIVGSEPASGFCRFNFFGTSAPLPYTTALVTTGTVQTFALSSIAPGFQGYAIIDCDFPMARALSVVLPFGATSSAASQQAEILPQTRQSNNRPLLYPYVSNASGLDTGIVISNTSSDTSGSEPASGKCTMHFYGTSAPADLETSSIAAGNQYVTLASTIAPGFNGYMIASCPFRLSRGYAYIENLGVPTYASVIDAEVIDPLDSDGDFTPDLDDGCPSDIQKTAPGICGCGVADTDTDSDGTPDCNDACSSDSTKTAAGVCGCGVPETDSDADGTPDCTDLCASDSAKIAPGSCGCGVAETDSDADGTANCVDLCQNDAAKTAPGVCGCGVSDADANSNGAADCLDPTGNTTPTKAVLSKQKPRGKTRVSIKMQTFTGRVVYKLRIEGKTLTRRNVLVRKTLNNKSSYRLDLSPGTYKVTYAVIVGAVTSKKSPFANLNVRR